MENKDLYIERCLQAFRKLPEKEKIAYLERVESLSEQIRERKSGPVHIK